MNESGHLGEKFHSDNLALNGNEENAVFLGINHIDILKIKGLEFYHLFLIILVKDPSMMLPYFRERLSLLYDVKTRDCEEAKVVYYNPSKVIQDTIWETTISASSECAYDTTKSNLGNLIKVPNFDRVDNHKSWKRVFIKKMASNDIGLIKMILEFESRYDNSLRYALIPEATKNGFNSNSYVRGVLEYAGLVDALKIPNCFKAPGLSRGVMVKHRT